MKPLLGAFVEIGLFEGSSTDATSHATAMAAAFATLECFHRRLSFQDPDSELTRLNRSRGMPVVLSSLTMRALRLARAMTLASNGLFNCTVGGALVDRGRLPDHGDAAHIAVGTADDLELSAHSARLRRPVRITLDGIAKGLAVDHAVAVLRRHGVSDAWINAGGDMRVIGRHPLPVRLRGNTLTVALRHGALATSVSRAEYDASLPGEILGPQARVAHGQWTVLADFAWRADALTKVAALASPLDRAALITKLGGQLLPGNPERSATLAA